MNNGFTLLETVIVIALMTSLAAGSAYIGFGTYARILTLSGGEDVSAYLRSARGSAMRGMCYGIACVGAVGHGVHLTSQVAILLKEVHMKVEISCKIKLL